MKRYVKKPKKLIKIDGEYIGESSGSFASSGSLKNSDYADIMEMLDPNREIVKDNYYSMDYLNESVDNL
jgi:hypothetical protein